VLGNDIVDLSNPVSSQKIGDGPFIRRFLSSREEAHVLRAERPAEALWAHFAAKEAVFKALKKLDPHTPVPWKAISIEGTEARFESHLARLSWQWGRSYVHCHAWLGKTLPPSPWIRVETGTEDGSRRLRELAKIELEGAGFPGCEIRRDEGPERWRPPRIYREGKLWREAEVSFSHDGPHVALALWVGLLHAE
jgi:phosphopantetheinyl transferase (holo-ACP synthase)